MSLILSGTDGLSDVDGTAATPAIRGTDANTGIFFGTDIIGFSEGGVEAARINADSQFVAAAGTAALPVITTTGDTNTGIFFPAADTIAFSEGGAECARFDSSGNFGLGVTPSAWNSVYRAVQLPFGACLSGRTDTPETLLASNTYRDSGGFKYFGTGSATSYFQTVGSHIWQIAGAGTAGNAITFTQAMTLDASGNLLVGTTSATGKVEIQYNGGVVVGQNINDSANTTNSTLMQFLIQGTQAGTIKRVGATSAVVYNTASDYRLKNVTGAVTGQGDRIDALKPIDYLWKEGNTQARGFLAHEFQAVYPNSVSGDKDDVDTNNKPMYQAMQASTSEVMADLVAEIQSLRKRLAALESA